MYVWRLLKVVCNWETEKIQDLSSLCKETLVCSIALCKSRSKQPTLQFHVELWEKSSVILMDVFMLWPGMTLKNPWFWLSLSLCYWINPSHAVTLSVQVLNCTSADLYRFMQSLEQQHCFWVAFLVKKRKRARCASFCFLHLIFQQTKELLGYYHCMLIIQMPV